MAMQKALQKYATKQVSEKSHRQLLLSLDLLYFVGVAISGVCPHMRMADKARNKLDIICTNAGAITFYSTSVRYQIKNFKFLRSW